MTPKQMVVLHDLARRKCPASPTEIGMKCGKPYHSASSWACQALSPLVSGGLAFRKPNGTYEITDAGRQVILGAS